MARPKQGEHHRQDKGVPSVADRVSAAQAEPQERASTETPSRDAIFVQYCREVLLRQECTAATQAKAFLDAAGMNWGSLARLPLGVLDAVALARRHVARLGVSAEDWQRLRLVPQLESCLIGPIQEASGEIVTYWARATTPETRCYLFRDRWDYRPFVYGMDQLAEMRPTHAFVVERIIDALVLRSWGVEPVLALARRFDQTLPDVWQDLYRWGVVQVTLLPVGPEVPGWVLRGARDQAHRALRRPDMWLIPPRRIAPNLGRWIASLGTEDFPQWIRDYRIPFSGKKVTHQWGLAIPALSAGSPVNPPWDAAKAPRNKAPRNSEVLPKELADSTGAIPSEASSSGAMPSEASSEVAKAGQETPLHGTIEPARGGICPKHGRPIDECFCFD